MNCTKVGDWARPMSAWGSANMQNRRVCSCFGRGDFLDLSAGESVEGIKCLKGILKRRMEWKIIIILGKSIICIRELDKLCDWILYSLISSLYLSDYTQFIVIKVVVYGHQHSTIGPWWHYWGVWQVFSFFWNPIHQDSWGDLWIREIPEVNKKT